MATIRAKCSKCGPVQVNHLDATLVISRDAAFCCVKFSCPSCRKGQMQDITHKSAVVMVALGCQREVLEVESKSRVKHLLTHCSNCRRDVELLIELIELNVEPTSLTYGCPKCGHEGISLIDANQAEILFTAGAPRARA